MGRNSQQRRAQRKRRQEQQERLQQRQRPGTSGSSQASRQPPAGRGDFGAELQEMVLATAWMGNHADDKLRFERGAAHLIAIELEPDLDRPVSDAISGMLQRLVGNLLEGGWQPADIAHLVRRQRTARAHRLAIALIAAQSRQHDAATRAPQPWLSQLEDLGVYDPARATIVGGQPDAFARWSASERLHADEVITISLLTMATLLNAPRLSFLIDPPSKWSASNRGSLPRQSPSVPIGDVDTKALKLIRALLAKAEATTFEAEAETFTAKAQEMMTRHSIDAAVLASANKGSGAGSGIESRRVHIDNPYADEKATFLSIIADVNGARAIWSPAAGFVTVMGFPVDLHLTDLLFTSLLVQATHAAAEATARERRSRTPSYRRAFLLAYAYRIGERLEAAKRQTSATAAEDYGESLLPILADKQAAVDAAYEEAFPNSTPMKGRSLDAAGYHAGRAAAERAHIGAGEAIARGAS